jgi:hypothetical protein
LLYIGKIVKKGKYRDEQDKWDIWWVK